MAPRERNALLNVPGAKAVLWPSERPRCRRQGPPSNSSCRELFSVQGRCWNIAAAPASPLPESQVTRLCVGTSDFGTGANHRRGSGGAIRLSRAANLFVGYSLSNRFNGKSPTSLSNVTTSEHFKNNVLNVNWVFRLIIVVIDQTISMVVSTWFVITDEPVLCAGAF
jgi:hypothetical protein